MNISTLPELDRRRTQVAIESMLEKYRIFKTVTFEAKEASTTYSYTERFHGPTNTVTDQTAAIASYNVDIPAARRAYCSAIDSVVETRYERTATGTGKVYEKRRDVRLYDLQSCV